jgi:RHS repeat-associated protein
VQYTYDPAGRMTQVQDPTGTYSFTYDNMGRLTSTTTAYTFLTARNFTVQYTYDAASNRKTMTDPESGGYVYSYDALNRLSNIQDFQQLNYGFTYDNLSRRKTLTRPNSITTSYSYDEMSHLLSILHKNAGGTTLDGATYTYDNAGNRKTRTPKPTGTALTYTYDNIYQLQTVKQGATTKESYTDDLVGNRLSSLGVSPYTYNSSNWLTSIPGTTYNYDNNGSLTSKSDGTTYNWDFENRLTQVVLPGTGGTVTFKYDPMGRRIQKAFTQGATTTTTNYVYDGANSIEEVDANGAVVARYTQGLGIDEPLAELRSSTTSYYDADGLGSITSLSNTTGALANTYSYDSFGKLTASTGTIVNPFQYTARDYDAETGLRYYRARFYDQNIGRFFSEDPSEREGTGPDVNLYAYVQNRPTNYVDPYGLYSVKPGVPAPSAAIDSLLRCIEARSKVSLFVTSTTDSHPSGTPHGRGVAVDIRYPSHPDVVLCAAAQCGAGYALDEAVHPSANATGPHLHIQLPRGRNGGRGDLPNSNCCIP